MKSEQNQTDWIEMIVIKSSLYIFASCSIFWEFLNFYQPQLAIGTIADHVGLAWKTSGALGGS